MLDILRDALDSGGADYRGGHACGAERESKCDRGCFFGPAMQKIVLEFLKSIPIRPRVPIAGRLLAVTPGRVGDRPLHDHAHPARHRLRQYAIDSLLVRDTDRDLQSVERAAFDRVHGVVGIDTASNEARLSAFARLLENLYHAAVFERLERRAVELHDVDMVGAQVLETALDTPREHRGLPVRARVTRRRLG